MPKQYYELVNDKSAKFWEVEQQNSTVHLRWGKIGTNGQSKIKELDSQEDAAKEVEKLINQKTKKGYVTAKASTVTTASPAKAKTTIKTSKKASTKKTATKNKPATIINPATASKPTLLKYVKDPSRTTAELKKSIERYVEVDRAIAQREEVSPVLLSKLSHSSDKNTRSKVIANPNISTEDYIRLGPQFPKEFLANPILDLILLEDPAILSEFDTKLLVQITKNPACSEGFLRWAASHKDEQVQLAVAMNSKTPEDALKILKASDHKAVKESLSSKAKVSKGATVDELEEEFVEAVKGRISGLPIEGKHHYSWETKDGKDRYETGLDDLWYYPKKTLGLPQFYLFSLKSKLSLVSSKCTEYHINKIKKHTGSSLTLRKSVASNILTPIYLLEELVNDSDSSVSENAKNSLEKVQLDNIENDVVSISSAKISKSERDKIAQQEKGFIKDPGAFCSHIASWNRYQAKCDFYKDAAGNINTSGEVLSRIANGISSIVHSSEFTQELKMLVAINPSTKKDTLVKLSKSKSRSLRRQLMKNPNLSFELESYLKRDENLDIEIYESKHTDTPTNRLIELSKHDSADVLTGVSEHFNTPDNIAIELINKLKQNKDASIRVSVSKNHLTSSSILDELANDKNKGVRLNVAKHDNTTENTLRYLVNDTTPHPNATDNGERFKIRDTAILSKNLANSLRAEILDKDKYIKIVKELCLPEEALLILGNSTNEKIKQAALSNTSHPEWQRTIREDVKSNPWFIAQLKKASEEVQKAVKENNILFFSGKDANKAVLSRRPISMILALSSGTNILPERIARVSKSTDWLIRAAVARNLGTPPNILKRLTEDSHSLVAALAKLTQDKLSGNISSTSDTSKLDTEQVAQDIAERIRNSAYSVISPLDEIWGSACSLQHLWVPELTDQLDKEWGDKEWEKFSDFLKLQAQCMSKSRKVDYVRKFAVSNKTNAIIYELFKKNSDIKYDLSQSQYTGIEILKLLAKDKTKSVQLYLYRNPNIPATLLELRALDKNKDAFSDDFTNPLEYVASHPNTPVPILKLLANAKNIKVRCSIALNPNTPVATLELLAKDKNITVRYEVTKNSKTPEKTTIKLLDKLAKSGPGSIRIYIAENSNTPVPILELLAKDKNIEVRCGIALNSNTPEKLTIKLLEKLVKDDKNMDKYDLSAIARSSKTPDTVLELLAKKKDPKRTIYNDKYTPAKEEVAENINTPATTLELLVKEAERYNYIRLNAANNPNTPVETLKLLIESKECYPKDQIHSAIAGNPNSSGPILEKLANRKKLRHIVANNPSTSVLLLEKLAKDEDEEVRSIVAKNPNTPKTILKALSNTLSQVINLDEVFKNIKKSNYKGLSYPQLVLRSLGELKPPKNASNKDLIQALTALHYLPPHPSNKDLTKASRSEDYLTRLAVALHSDTTEAQLKLLVNDIDKNVASASAMALNSKQ